VILRFSEKQFPTDAQEKKWSISRFAGLAVPDQGIAVEGGIKIIFLKGSRETQKRGENKVLKEAHAKIVKVWKVRVP